MKFIHSTWAYLVVFMFVFILIKYIISLLRDKQYTYGQDFRLALFTLIVLYIQVVLGFLNYFVSPYFEGLKQGHFSTYMKNAPDRLLVIEHPVMMLLVLLLVHYGFNRHKKKNNSKRKFINIIIFYGIGFFLILLRIPWHNWLSS